MEPLKKQLMLERVGEKEIARPEAPFTVPTGMPSSYMIDGVPYFAQEEMTWSGAAVLQMLAEFHGLTTDQASLVAMATIDPYPSFGTETWRENSRRVATLLGFNAMSYYPFRYLSLEQIAVHEPAVHQIDAAILKSIIAGNQPAYVRLRQVRTDKIVSADVSKWLEMVGHAMLVVGYDRDSFFVHDPWNSKKWGGEGGPVSQIQNDVFADLWVDGCRGYILVIQPAADIEIDTIPTYPRPGESFDLPVRFIYPANEALSAWAPIVKNPLATLKVDSMAGICLRTGQHPVKRLGDTFAPNDTLSVRWGLLGNRLVSEMVAEVTFEGVVEEPNAPFPYAAKVSNTVSVTLPKNYS